MDIEVGKENKHMMQISPFDNPEVGIFHCYLAHIQYFSKDQEADYFTGDASRQKAIRPKRIKDRFTIPIDITMQVGDIPNIFLTRADGEIEMTGIGHESLKLMAGNTPNYELIRKDVLFVIAQLVCRREQLREIYGNIFATKKGKKRKRKPIRKGKNIVPGSVERDYPAGSALESPAEKAARIKKLLSRDPEEFTPEPEEDLEEEDFDVEDVEEWVDVMVEGVKEASQVVGHKRLLPLFLKEVEDEQGNKTIEYTPGKPSKAAIENASADDKTLLKGLEFVNLGEVFKPEEVPALLGGLGFESLEELAQAIPDAHIRYETYIKKHTRGDEVTANMIAIKGKIRDGSEN